MCYYVSLFSLECLRQVQPCYGLKMEHDIQGLLPYSFYLHASTTIPAIDVLKSATRRAELLFDPEEYKCLELLRRGMASMNDVTAMEKLIQMLEKYPSNSELLESFKVR